MIRLLELRKERGLSQREAAKIFGVSQGTFNNGENANTQPSIEQLIALARFFEVSVDYLVDNSDYTGTINMVSSLTSEQKELVSLYTAAPEHLRNAIMTILHECFK